MKIAYLGRGGPLKNVVHIGVSTKEGEEGNNTSLS